MKTSSAKFAELKRRGVNFAEYDKPGMKAENGIYTGGGAKAAWFKDSEGNTPALIQDVVNLEGASHALRFLARTHHEALDEELATAVEEVSERDLSLWHVEDIFLLDPDPRELTPLPADLVALARVGLLPF